MSINVTVIANKTTPYETTMEIDLIDHVEDWDAFREEICEALGIDTDENEIDDTWGDIKDTLTIEGRTTDFDDVETFLGISFEDDEQAELYWEYVACMGVDMDSKSEFDEKYERTCKTTAEFCEEQSTELCELDNIPDYIRSCIDWERVWSANLRHDYYDIECESGVAIFRR